MENIIKSTILEYDKSTFLIDLRRHKSGKLYLAIKQMVEGISDYNILKINYSLLSDLIYVLMDYNNEVLKEPVNNTKLYFSQEKQKEIVSRYLKGVPIEDLSMQFDCKQLIIEQILRNKQIAIVNNKLPTQTRKRWFRRKKY
ncbi:MAG: hypothetical protein K0B15_12375 [Lentimicrobium sp.]|nr:hypothetical protein [Lentimicrobium sp.]